MTPPNTPSPSHVAIIGCGFTGTSALVQLIERYPVRRVTVFEASGHFGPGYPYQLDECADYLVNNTTDTMCLLPENRQAFIQWLRGRRSGTPHDQEPEPAAKGHVPRRLYGQFLVEAVQAARTMAAIKGIEVELIAAEVTDIDEPEEGDQGGALVRWAGGERPVDAVILAAGRCPDSAPLSAPPAGSTARRIASHIGNADLDNLALDATCHVLGASLSAYDVVNRLFSPATGCRFEPVDGADASASGALRLVPGPNQRRVVLCSRRGRLKRMQSLAPMPIRRTRFTAEVLQDLADRGELTLDALAGLIQDEARLHGVTPDWSELLQPYADCRSADAVNQRAGDLLARDIASARDGSNFAVDLAGNAQLLLWDAFAAHGLNAQDEPRYRRELEQTVLCISAPCPVPTAQRLLALHRAGRLVVRHGVREVAWSDEHQAYRIACALGDEHAQVLIDATGRTDRRVDSPAQGALIRSLHRRGLLRPHAPAGVPGNGVAVDMASFRAEGSRSIHVVGMWLWGPGFFTSSAFMMASLVKRLLDGLYRGRVSSHA